MNQATIARFEEGIAWPRQPEEVLMAYASELYMDVRLLWLHAFVLWIEHEPVLDKQSQERDSGRAQAAEDLGRGAGSPAQSCHPPMRQLERLICLRCVVSHRIPV